MQQLQKKSTLQLPTGSFRVCKGLTETHELHFSWVQAAKWYTGWGTLKNSKAVSTQIQVLQLSRFPKILWLNVTHGQPQFEQCVQVWSGHHLIQGHKTIIFPKEGCNSFKHYFYYTFAEQFLQKAIIFKTLKLVTFTVTLENWLKCHLNTLSAKLVSGKYLHTISH